MKRLVLLVVVTVMAVGVAFSADMNYGVRTGLSLASMSLDPELDEWGPPTDDEIAVKFYAGLWIQYPLGENMGLMAELNYVQKGDKNKITETTDDIWFNFYGNFIELPLLFYYVPMEKMHLYAGPVFGYLLKGGYVQVVDIPDPEISQYMGYDMGEFLNRFELSAAIGARYQFAGRYFGELRYTLGFSNMFKEDGLFPDDLEGKTRSFSFGIGVQL
ncbi:PorT family protein [Candidatus Mcinerneyibacteriota bacterium]|nr:PorT family protein [Candidatus Mcinerneyibacteriota bacterium]